MLLRYRHCRYHNPIDLVYKLPSSKYALACALMWEHCWPDALSFVILDRQHTATQPNSAHSHNGAAAAEAAAGEDERHFHWPVAEHDHEADLASVDESAIVGVILNNDGSRQLQWPREDPAFKEAMSWSDDFLLWTTLYGEGDLRADPTHPLHRLYQPATTPAAPPRWRKGEHVHCFLLATHCRCRGERLASYLTQALYYHAQRLGFSSMHVEASHPATAHLFQSGVMSRGVVTHRVAPSAVVKKLDSGEEQRRWAALADDVVAVHVEIDQSLTFSLLPYPLAIFKLPAASAVPQWALDPSIDLVSITRTRHELSILAPASLLPAPLPGGTQSGWRALAVHGPLPFGLVGVLQRVLSVLAAERIAVLAVSTYDTDVVLVSEASVNEAVRVLQLQGHRILVEPATASVTATSKQAEGKKYGQAQSGVAVAENGAANSVAAHR